MSDILKALIPVMEALVQMDFAYMRRWADELGLTDLLERAIREAKISRGGGSR